MDEILGKLLAMGGIVWSCTEVLGRATGWGKERCAIVLGPLVGLIAHYLGQLELPAHGHENWLHWPVSAGLGVLAALLAKGAHDSVQGVINRRNGKVKGGGANGGGGEAVDS